MENAEPAERFTGWKPVPRVGNCGTAILAVRLTGKGSNSEFGCGTRPGRPFALFSSS